MQNLAHALDVLPRLGLLIARVGHRDDVGPQACCMECGQQGSEVHAAAKAQRQQPAIKGAAQCIALVPGEVLVHRGPWWAS